MDSTKDSTGTKMAQFSVDSPISKLKEYMGQESTVQAEELTNLEESSALRRGKKSKERDQLLPSTLD